MRPLVLIPCSASKRSAPAPAWCFYTGTQYRKVLRAALAGTTRERILIVSALHGLLALTDVVGPYEQRIDEPGAITPERIHAQAVTRGVIHAHEVIALIPHAYVDVCRPTWPHMRQPLKSKNIARQMAVFNRITRGQAA